MFGAYAFGQGYFADGPAGTAVIAVAPGDLVQMQASIRRQVDLEAHFARSVGLEAGVRRTVKTSVER